MIIIFIVLSIIICYCYFTVFSFGAIVQNQNNRRTLTSGTLITLYDVGDFDELWK
jgi:hypothetical protein